MHRPPPPWVSFAVAGLVGAGTAGIDAYDLVTARPLPPIHLHQFAVAAALAAFVSGVATCVGNAVRTLRDDMFLVIGRVRAERRANPDESTGEILARVIDLPRDRERPARRRA